MSCKGFGRDFLPFIWLVWWYYFQKDGPFKGFSFFQQLKNAAVKILWGFRRRISWRANLSQRWEFHSGSNLLKSSHQWRHRRRQWIKTQIGKSVNKAMVTKKQIMWAQMPAGSNKLILLCFFHEPLPIYLAWSNDVIEWGSKIRTQIDKWKKGPNVKKTARNHVFFQNAVFANFLMFFPFFSVLTQIFSSLSSVRPNARTFHGNDFWQAWENLGSNWKKWEKI